MYCIMSPRLPMWMWSVWTVTSPGTMIQATWRSSPSSSTLSLRTGMESTRNPSFRVNMGQMQCRGFTVWGITHMHIQWLNSYIFMFCSLLRQLSFHAPGPTRDVYWGVPEGCPAELPRRVWPEEEAVCCRWTYLELCWFHDCTRYESRKAQQPVEPDPLSFLPVYKQHTLLTLH